MTVTCWGRTPLTEDGSATLTWYCPGSSFTVPREVLVLSSLEDAEVRATQEGGCDPAVLGRDDEGAELALHVGGVGDDAGRGSGTGPRTALTPEVLAALGLPSTGDPRQALVAAVTPQPPASWARFAPLALQLDGQPLALQLDGQDGVATALLDKAAAHLVRSARAVGASDQVVFAGGLLERGGLRARLEQHFTGPHAAFPVVGACLVAADEAGLAVDTAALTAQVASASQAS